MKKWKKKKTSFNITPALYRTQLRVFRLFHTCMCIQGLCVLILCNVWYVFRKKIHAVKHVPNQNKFQFLFSCNERCNLFGRPRCEHQRIFFKFTDKKKNCLLVSGYFSTKTLHLKVKSVVNIFYFYITAKTCGHVLVWLCRRRRCRCL